MTQANFAACCDFVRKQEGGNTDTPGDRGGRTGRGGITHTTYDAYRARKGLPSQDVFQISSAEIAEIYAVEYWIPIYGDRLPAGEDLALFDYAINSGPAKANLARIDAKGSDSAALIREICESRLAFMHALGSWSRFGAGWGRRVTECEALALRMAGELTPATVDLAKESHSAKQGRVQQIIVGGGGVIAGTVHFGVNHWIIAALLAVIVAAVAIAQFNAHRHGARADTLASAVSKMQAAQAIAAAARANADAQVAAKAKTIEAEQNALAAVRAALGVPSSATNSK